MEVQEAIKILGLSAEDLEEVINKKYKQQAKKYHPDAGGNDSDMVQLNQAKNEIVNYFNNIVNGNMTSNVDDLQDMNSNLNDFWDEVRKSENKRHKEYKNADIINKIRKEFDNDLHNFLTNNNLKHCNKNYEKFYRYIGEQLKKNGIMNIDYNWSIHLNIYKYYYCIKKFYELYTDNSTYQLRKNKYFYRVWKENGKLKQQYIGKELPDSAMGFRKAKERKKYCANKAVKSMVEIYGEKH